ncbi:DUF6789 family protein [Piscinibacter sakaiensis]|uniref:DUF6789 family protein n=1 Tax=Piscinibacter sakaiensis TaxID=1547922 RepID=UPI003AAB61D0
MPNDHRDQATISKGLLAGLAATAVLSALMWVKAMMGVMPELDLPGMLASMMGAPDTPALGWAAHLMIGIVGYGLLISKAGLLATGSPITNGIVLAAVGWLVMMVVLMPLAGAGLFALSLGLMAPLMTLMLHLIFGAVLGWAFGRLVSDARAMGGHHRPGQPRHV